MSNRYLFGLIKTEEEIILKEQVFSKDGSCLSAKEGYPLCFKEGNIKLNLDETNYRFCLDENGQYVRKIHEFHSSNGLIKKYYPNEKIFEVRNKDGDLLEHFSPTGESLPLLKDFEDGKDGVYTKYEQDFSRQEVNYKGGKKNGPARIYDAEGKILTEVSYHNDPKRSKVRVKTIVAGTQYTNPIQHLETVRRSHFFQCVIHFGRTHPG